MGIEKRKNSGRGRTESVSSYEDSNDELEQPSRRGFLGQAIGATIMIGGITAIANKSKKNAAESPSGSGSETAATEEAESVKPRELSAEEKQAQEDAERRQELTAELDAAHPVRVETKNAEGMRLTSLARAYLGYPQLERNERLDDSVLVNGARAINGLHESKFRFMRTHGKEPSVEMVREAEKRSLDYAKRWNHPELYGGSFSEALGLTTFSEVIQDAEKTLAPIRDVLAKTQQEKGVLEVLYDLSRAEAAVSTARALIARLQPSVMMSYTMTELGLTVDEYDLILRSIGEKGVDEIESQYDFLPSRGPYQLTHFAIGDSSADTDVYTLDPIVRVGASKIASLLPDNLMIPKHLDDLKTFNDHASAALLFAVHNICRACEIIPKTQFEILRDMDDETLVAYVSTSHNNPSLAIRAIQSWANEKHIGREVDYLSICNPKIKPYGQRSVANQHSLGALLAAVPAAGETLQDEFKKIMVSDKEREERNR